VSFTVLSADVIGAAARLATRGQQEGNTRTPVVARPSRPGFTARTYIHLDYRDLPDPTLFVADGQNIGRQRGNGLGGQRAAALESSARSSCDRATKTRRPGRLS